MRINVLDYGAAGDGLTDDAVAIQEAISDFFVTPFRAHFPAQPYGYVAVEVHLEGLLISIETDPHEGHAIFNWELAESVYNALGVAIKNAKELRQIEEKKRNRQNAT